jgi:hypothetical protein
VHVSLSRELSLLEHVVVVVGGGGGGGRGGGCLKLPNGTCRSFFKCVPPAISILFLERGGEAPEKFHTTRRLPHTHTKKSTFVFLKNY